MAENDKVLLSSFKKIAEILGSKWKYSYHDSHIPQEDNYMDSEDINFNLNGEELLLTFHHSDPTILWIYSGLFQISFGPVDHIHFFEEEPKVVLESFNQKTVSFIEIFSNGQIHEYHHFEKATYRPALHNGIRAPKVEVELNLKE